MFSRWYNPGVSVPPASAPIIGFVSDPEVIDRFERASGKLNLSLIWIERKSQIASPSPEPDFRQLAEPLFGQGAGLIEVLTAWKPCLILVDLDNSEIPWRKWVALIKSVPATRRMPLVCFASTLADEIQKAAREAGADAVLERAAFLDDLPALMRKYAHLPDFQLLQDACRQPLSNRAMDGLSCFNEGMYFEAHEALEDAWNEDSSPGRALYQAILQAAVAYYQIERGNYAGAQKMFLRLRQWIDPLPGWCRGVNVSRLRQDIRAVQKSLRELGPERIAEFDRGLFQPLEYLEQE